MTATPYALKLTDAAAAIREGALTSEALTRSLLDRIDATDVAIDAWAFLDTDRALAKARAIDALRSEGRNLGALAGIGIGVKDIIATADLPTQMGSPIYAGVRAAFAAECVMRLERAGAFVLGKTVTTEFAFLHPGKTRNPWRRVRPRRLRSAMCLRRSGRKPTVR